MNYFFLFKKNAFFIHFSSVELLFSSLHAFSQQDHQEILRVRYCWFFYFEQNTKHRLTTRGEKINSRKKLLLKALSGDCKIRKIYFGFLSSNNCLQFGFSLPIFAILFYRPN